MTEQAQDGADFAAVGVARSAPAFVGRADELGWLGRCLEAAAAGQPQIALIVGEPGIGKTRLLRELQASARRRGFAVCAGRGFDDLTVPFLPIAEALAPQCREHAAALDRDLGDHAEIVRRFVMAGAPAPATAAGTGPGDERLRLLLAVSRAVVALSHIHPLLFVLDDLHWVDPASLEVFAHLVFSIADAAGREHLPLLVVGSTRPVEPEQRIARTLTRFQRESICQTLELAGLTESEVMDLVRGLGLRRASHQLIAAVNDATHGNPLFIQEVVHHLVRRGALEERGGHLALRTLPLDVQLPPDLTAALAGRIRELSPRCRTLLTLAAFLGDTFTLAPLAAVAKMPSDESRMLLEEAGAQQVVLCDEGTYQFAHPLIRQLLYAEPPTAWRQRYHAEIAAALSTVHGGPDEHLLAIAHHLVAAGPLVEPAHVVETAQRAGDRALATAAWREAARYYEAALAADETAHRLSAAARAELHYQAGVAHFRDQDAGPCLAQFDSAVVGYRACGDWRGLARALMGTARARFTLASVSYGTLIDPGPLQQAAKQLATQDPGLCGFIYAELAQVFWTARDSDRAETMARQALAAGERLGDDVLCAEAHRAHALVQGQRMRVTESLASLEQGLVCARRSGDAWLESHMVQRLPLALTWLGRLDEAEARGREAAELTRRTHDWGDHSLSLGALVCVDVARGAFDAAERHAHQAVMMCHRSGYPWAGPTALPALASARACRGSWAEADDALALLVEPGEVFEEPGPALQVSTFVFRQLVQAWADPSADALAVIRERVGGLPRLIDPQEGADAYATSVFCALVEIGDLVGSPGMAQAAAALLDRAAQRGVLISSGWVFLVSRVLAVIAMLEHDWERATASFGAAAAQAAAIGARPELARTFLDHARMLIARGRRSDRRLATRLVHRALPILTELGMTPFIARARTLADTLEAPLPPAPKRQAAAVAGVTRRDLELLSRIARGRTDPEIARELVLGPSTVARQVQRLLAKIGVDGREAAAAWARARGLAPETAAASRVPQALRIILFTDVAGSTTLIQTLGDTAARALLRTHDEIVRRQLAQAGGTAIKHTGDGVMAWFASVTSALECAIAIQQRLADHNAREPIRPLVVRVGLNAGEPIAENGDLFGASVSAAARICAHARPGQILVAEVVRQLARGKPFTFVDCGRVPLRGFSERFRLFEVPWAAVR